MADGIGALLEDLRTATDGILVLPDALLRLAMGEGPVDLVRRMDRLDKRLPALRLLVDAREIGKTLVLVLVPGADGAAMSKIVEAVEAAPGSPRGHDLMVVFDLTEQGLGELASALRLTAVADDPVVAVALDAIGRARAVYRRLQDMPADALAASRTLPEFVDHAVRLGEAGRALVERVDEHRRTLDRAYGQR